VNGSTGGLLAAIYASAELWKQRGLEGPIYLVAANCHKSVWNGLRLVGAETKLLLPTGDPEYGPVQSDALSEALDELEKSIVANIADDIQVSVEGNHIEMIIRKKFNPTE
jgi:arginine/lysine/ornithine decarboxylase